jgi:hypothetical protein
MHQGGDSPNALESAVAYQIPEMKMTTIKYHPVEGLGTEYLETCAKCGRRFSLLDMRLDGDGQFRCLGDSFGPNPSSIAEANSLLADYFTRKPELMAQIECFTHTNTDLGGSNNPLRVGVESNSLHQWK